MSKKKFHVPLIAVITALFTISMTGIAAADNLQSDLETTTGGLDKTVNRGTLSPNTAYTQDVFLFVQTQPGGTNDPSYPFDVSGSGNLGATFSGVTITSAGDANGQTGQVAWTTPAAQATAQNYSIVVTFDANTTINESPAGVTINFSIAAAPSNTAPGVSVTNVSEGASYEHGSVPTAMCQVTDTEDGPIADFAATLGAISGPLSSYGLGSQTASCSYTDGGGLTASAEVTYSIVDTTAPIITFVSRTAANGNGWSNTDVTVNWSCADSGSGVVAASVSQTVSAEGANQSTTGICTDNAGNTASDTQIGINIDKTDPTVSASAAPAANSNGWNNTDVTVSFSGSDGLSGVDFCSAPVTLSAEAAGQSASGTCTDKAGNVSATATASGINIDKTAPDVSLVGGPQGGQSYYFGSVPAAPTCSASDTLSGLDGSCTVSGYGTVVGTHTVTANAGDLAGNSASATATYTVLAWTLNGFYAPVDMNGVWNTIKGGSTVPLKFDVFAGPTELTDPSVVDSFTVKGVACPVTGIVTDDIEMTTTGSTTLRYDDVAGQFIQNWQTPKKPGACYQVTMKTDDGSAISALFKLK